MKSKNYLVIGIIVIWGLFVLSGCVNENEILIQSYSYSYKKDISSHQIRGIWETLSFKYENTEFTLESEQTSPGPSYGKTSFEYNFSDDKSINLYIPGEEIPESCIGNIQTPDNFYSYGIVEMDCSVQLKLIILDQTRFTSCIEDESCTLTYGEEIEISSE